MVRTHSTIEKRAKIMPDTTVETTKTHYKSRDVIKPKISDGNRVRARLDPASPGTKNAESLSSRSSE